MFDDDPIIILRRRFSLSCLCSDENKKNEETKKVKKVKKEKKRGKEIFHLLSEKEELKNTREIIDTFYYSHLHFKKNDYCY